jgi:hypothetical protein
MRVFSAADQLKVTDLVYFGLGIIRPKTNASRALEKMDEE